MRYFVGFFISIGLIILLIILLVGGGGKSKVPSTSKTLDSYSSTDAQASLTIDGPINAETEHQAVRITVSRDDVTFEQIQGYDENVVQQKVFPNSENAFDVFLHALQHVGFTKGNTDSKLADEKGLCPLGDRYIFKFEQGGQTLERFWATNCGGTKTYNGNLGVSLQLFQNQVPGYNQLVNGVNF